MFYLRYLCLLAHSGVQYVSLDCPFLIAPSVFFNVYFNKVQKGFRVVILTIRTFYVL